jgi:hypothetical protein
VVVPLVPVEDVNRETPVGVGGPNPT